MTAVAAATAAALNGGARHLPSPMSTSSFDSSFASCAAPVDVTYRRFSWARAHRPQRVLDAPRMTADFYSQPVAWGQDLVCAALDSQVLLFDPEKPQGMVAYVNAPLSEDSTMLTASSVCADDTIASTVPPCSPHPYGGSSYADPAIDSSPSFIAPVPAHFRRLPIGGAPIEVSAVCFTHRIGASPSPSDAHVVIGDRRGRVVALSKAEGSSVLVPQCLRRVPEEDLFGPAPHWALPHSLGVTALHTHFNTVGVGLGTGGIEIIDTRVRHRPTATIVARQWTYHSERSAFVSPLNASLVQYCTPAITALCFSPDGACIATGHCDGVVRIWSLSKPTEPVAEVRHLDGGVRCAWSPNHRGVIATCGGSLDGVLAVSDVHQASQIVPSAGGSLSAVATHTQITAVEWTDDASFLVTAHGFNFDELTQRAGGNAGPAPWTNLKRDIVPPIAVQGRSVSVWWAADVAARATSTLVEHQHSSFRSGGSRSVATPTLPSPALGSNRCRPEGFRVPLAPRPSGAMGGVNHHAAAPASQLPPQRPEPTWATVEVSPPVSPAPEPLSIVRTRTNRLDLMPLLLHQGGDDDAGRGDTAAIGATAMPLPPTAGEAGPSRATSVVSAASEELFFNGSTAPHGDIAPPPSLSLVGTLLGHTNRPLQLVRRGRQTGQFLTTSGGEGDETLRFWKPFNVGACSNAGTRGCSPLVTPSSAACAARCYTPVFDEAFDDTAPDFALR